MGILKRLFGWVVKSQVEYHYLSLDAEPAHPKDYFEAWQRIYSSPDGKIIASFFRGQVLAALAAVCPSELKTDAERSRWLAAHEALVSARRDMLAHITWNIQLLNKTEEREKIPPVTTKKVR